MQKENPYFYSFIFIFVFASCSNDKSYTMATQTKGTTYYTVGMAISEILKQVDVEMDILAGEELGSFVNCKMLWNDQVEFAIAQNDTKIAAFMETGMSISDSKIRTVAPLYPEILYVLHSDTLNPSSFSDLITGRRIGVGPINSGTSRFLKRLLIHFGIDSSKYTMVNTPWLENYVSDQIDVSVILAGFNTVTITDMLNKKNCEIFSFGNINLFEKGSSVEGFCMNYSNARPFIVPKSTYGIKPENPIMTIAVDAVLLCNKKVDDYTVYKIVDELYKQKSLLADMDQLLNGLSENFDRNKLGFPLHEGSKKFLNRDKPTLFERYAELAGVVISIFLAGFGGITTFVHRKKMNKKNRMDVYYEKVLRIENKFDVMNTKGQVEGAIKEIKEIKHEAFNSMISEKLTANEGFNIFLTLVDNLTLRLEKKLKSLVKLENIKK